MSNLHYDPYQFAGRGALPASAETGIAFSDYHTMHTAHHGGNPAALIPPFALNDKQLQHVLLLRAWRYVHNIGTPSGDRNKINADATAKALKGNNIAADAPAIQREMVEKHRAAVRKAGGYMQLHAAIAFRSWRLGMTSVEVAESLGATPQAVRQALWRLRDAAKALGFDVGRAGHTAGMKRKGKRKPPTEKRPLSGFDGRRAVALFRNGRSIREIACAMGYRLGTGQNRVRNNLIRAGVYTPKRNRAA